MTRATTAPRRWVDLALPALVAVGVGTMFLPWARSGKSSRHSFELVRSAERLDLLDGWVASVGLWVWLALPFVGAAAVLTLAMGRRLVGSLLAGIVALTLVAAVWVVKAAPLRADGGMTVALGVGVLIMALAVGGLIGVARGRTPDP